MPRIPLLAPLMLLAIVVAACPAAEREVTPPSHPPVGNTTSPGTPTAPAAPPTQRDGTELVSAGKSSFTEAELVGVRKIMCETGHGGSVIPAAGTSVASSSGFTATWKGDTLIVRCPKGPVPQW